MTTKAAALHAAARFYRSFTHSAESLVFPITARLHRCSIAACLCRPVLLRNRLKAALRLRAVPPTASIFPIMPRQSSRRLRRIKCSPTNCKRSCNRREVPPARAKIPSRVSQPRTRRRQLRSRATSCRSLINSLVRPLQRRHRSKPAAVIRPTAGARFFQTCSSRPRVYRRA
jgi:hypothetical protein